MCKVNASHKLAFTCIELLVLLTKSESKSYSKLTEQEAMLKNVGPKYKGNKYVWQLNNSPHGDEACNAKNPTELLQAATPTRPASASCIISCVSKSYSKLTEQEAMLKNVGPKNKGNKYVWQLNNSPHGDEACNAKNPTELLQAATPTRPASASCIISCDVFLQLAEQ